MKTQPVIDFIQKNHIILLLAVAAVIVAAVLYRTFITPTLTNNTNQLSIHEGFQVNGVNTKPIQDLLDKLTIDIYGKTSIWDNQLYRTQEIINELPISIWKPVNDTGEAYKLLGHAIGESKDYKMPRDTTMLIQGDTKPPIDAKLLFEFPHNQMTKPTDDIYSTTIYKGIRNLNDLDKRRSKLREGLESIEEYMDNLQDNINTIRKEVAKKHLNNTVDLYGSEGYFQSAAVTINLDENIRSKSFPRGVYNSMRIPVGSTVTLISENGGSMDINFPLEAVLDRDGNLLNNGDGPTINDFYRYIDGIQPDDFRVSGKYCLRARDYFGKDKGGGELNNRNNSTVNRKNAKDPNKVFMPYYSKDKRDINYHYNYKISPGAYPNDKNGRSDIYAYLLNDGYLDSGDSKKISKGRVGFDYINYIRTGDGKNSLLALDNTGTEQMRDALLYRVKDNVNIEYEHLHNIIKQVTSISTEEWSETESLSKIANNLESITNQTNIAIDKYYIDLAFTFRTWKRYIKPNFGVGTTIRYGKYDSRGEKPDTLEMLYRSGPSNFYGRMTGGAVIMTDDRQDVQHPALRKMEYITETIDKSKDLLVSIYNRMISRLDSIEQLVLQNQFKHFPIRIWRPTPPGGYTCIGDIALNHEDSDYNSRLPELGMIACIPKQCAKEVRDWLPIDKVYEYRNTDTPTNNYLAIYKNPYLQTFKISTQPGIVPSGKVEKVVACVEKCKVLDDIIEADKCAQEFYKANKRATESYNLDSENIIHNREGHIYRSRIREREDRLNSLREVARRLQIQDDKAHIVNQEYNRQKFQKLVDSQRHNINSLANKLDQDAHKLDVNVHFDYDKFHRLLFALRESERIPSSLYDRLLAMIADILAKQAAYDQQSDSIDTPQNGSDLSDDIVRQLLGECPSPESEGLILKSLVESGCYNCANLQ